MNKLDLMFEDEAQERCNEILKALNWTGKVFRISGLSREGCEELMRAAMAYLDQAKDELSEGFENDARDQEE